MSKNITSPSAYLSNDSSSEENNQYAKDIIIPAKPNDYETLFRKLDIEETGKITFRDFTKAMRKLKHPISENSELMKQVFNSFDEDRNKIIDFNDFKKYLSTTDDQILKGFNKIDEDNDGKLKKADFVKYLKDHLKVDASQVNVDLLFKRIDYKNDGYITYDEFREF